MPSRIVLQAVLGPKSETNIAFSQDNADDSLSLREDSCSYAFENRLCHDRLGFSIRQVSSSWNLSVDATTTIKSSTESVSLQIDWEKDTIRCHFAIRRDRPQYSHEEDTGRVPLTPTFSYNAGQISFVLESDFPNGKFAAIVEYGGVSSQPQLTYTREQDISRFELARQDRA